jgi:hypothetical protein
MYDIGSLLVRAIAEVSAIVLTRSGIDVRKSTKPGIS